MAGTLYVFFGSSSVGKDHIQGEFLNFSNNYVFPDGSKKRVYPVPRIHSRKRRATEDDTNWYEATQEEICNQDNYYSKVNDGYVGIRKSELKAALASGKNLVYVTGSIRMIQQLIQDSDLAESICLIYINGPGYTEEEYMQLEMQRYPDHLPPNIEQSVKERYNNSQLIQKFYADNEALFDYSYMNITKLANQEVAKRYSSVFFDSFFKTVLELRRESGPIWICNVKTKSNEEMTIG